jgi:hypothetical protein
VEARFGLFGDSANLDARKVHSLRLMYHRLGNRFGCTRLWYVAHVESHFSRFMDSVRVRAR